MLLVCFYYAGSNNRTLSNTILSWLNSPKSKIQKNVFCAKLFERLKISHTIEATINAVKIGARYEPKDLPKVYPPSILFRPTIKEGRQAIVQIINNIFDDLSGLQKALSSKLSFLMGLINLYSR